MPSFIYQLNRKLETPTERGIPKYPVESAHFTFSGMEGDYNRYRTEKKQGRLEAALMLMPLEMIQQLNLEGWPVQPGDLGENITSFGISYDAFAPGKIYRVGEAEIQISEPCTPCSNLKVLAYVGEERFTTFMRILAKPSNRRGWYAKVLEEGMVRKNDGIEEIVR